VIYKKLVLSCREILQRSKSSLNEKPDVHTRLMKKYKEVPQSWFLGILGAMIILSIIACEVYNDQLQLRWWGVLLACGLALFFTLPIGVITAITNQVCVFYLHMLMCKSCCKLKLFHRIRRRSLFECCYYVRHDRFKWQAVQSWQGIF
jgi:hypothetical protein